MLNRIPFAIPVLFLSGCSGTVTIKNAWMVESSKENSSIHVEISANDAAFIKRNQIYFSVVLTECSGKGKRFPLEPMIGGKRASDFEFDIPNVAVVDVIGSGPSWVIKGYHDPCVKLEGGGYFGARLKSNQTPLTIRKLR
jgi:hypothetical protein